MPLAGVICCHGGSPQSLKHCLAMWDGGLCQFPRHILTYLKEKEESRREVGYSVTSILGCAREQVLKKRIDYSERPDLVVARFVGDAVHRYAHDLNSGTPGYRGEERFWTEVTIKAEDGEGVVFRLSGQPDQIWAERTLIDLKVTGKIPISANPDHVAQVNLYAWLLSDCVDADENPVSIEITEAQITYLSPNTQRQATYHVALWSRERTEQFLQAALEPYLPWRQHGVYPEVLSPYLINHRDGHSSVDRNFRCDYCPIRQQCDELATSERGVSPNVAAYWEGRPVQGGGPQFVEDF